MADQTCGRCPACLKNKKCSTVLVCPLCDRSDCPTLTPVPGPTWEDPLYDSPGRPRLHGLEWEAAYAVACATVEHNNADCAAHAVDWRTRCLAAEADRDWWMADSKRYVALHAEACDRVSLLCAEVERLREVRRDAEADVAKDREFDAELRARVTQLDAANTETWALVLAHEGRVADLQARIDAVLAVVADLENPKSPRQRCRHCARVAAAALRAALEGP